MKLKDIIIETLFPREFTCDICKNETFGTNLCEFCVKTVTFNDGITCPICGRKTVRPEICLECKEKTPVFKKAVSSVTYDNGGAKLVSRFKNGYAYLKEYFADRMAEKIKELPAADLIVYVPTDKKSIRVRGYDQTRLLAYAVSKRTEIPVSDGVLIKIKENKEQKGLSRKERIENVRGKFKVADEKSVKGKRVLVIDDVLTTGATADEVCRILLSAKAKETYFATFASTEYKQRKDK